MEVHLLRPLFDHALKPIKPVVDVLRGDELAVVKEWRRLGLSLPNQARNWNECEEKGGDEEVLASHGAWPPFLLCLWDSPPTAMAPILSSPVASSGVCPVGEGTVGFRLHGGGGSLRKRGELPVQGVGQRIPAVSKGDGGTELSDSDCGLHGLAPSYFMGLKLPDGFVRSPVKAGVLGA